MLSASNDMYCMFLSMPMCTLMFLMDNFACKGNDRLVCMLYAIL